MRRATGPRDAAPLTPPLPNGTNIAMEKRYQVFVSSTYADLKEERRKVIQTLMEMDCIPSGMEIFPAADEEQWNFIKKVIDDCDYYLIIIGGRYGSTTADGVSYTEKEYDYAVGRGLKVLAFLHEKPEAIPVGKSDIDKDARERLSTFREKVATGRLVKFWMDANQLPGLLALSLTKTIKTYPAVGWIRADQRPSAEILIQVADLQKQNEELRKLSADLKSELAQTKPAAIQNLAGLQEETTVSGSYRQDPRFESRYSWSTKITWGDLFALMAPELLSHPNDALIRSTVAEYLLPLAGKSGDRATIIDQDFNSIKVQLIALRLVDVSYIKNTAGGMSLFWSLTQRGHDLMLELRTAKKADANKPATLRDVLTPVPPS